MYFSAVFVAVTIFITSQKSVVIISDTSSEMLILSPAAHSMFSSNATLTKRSTHRSFWVSLEVSEESMFLWM